MAGELTRIKPGIIDLDALKDALDGVMNISTKFESQQSAIDLVNTKVLDMAIQLDVLSGRTSSVSDIFIESFVNEDNVDDLISTTEQMDDTWNDNWKEVDGQITHQKGFIRNRHKSYKLEILEKFNMAFGLRHKADISDYDIINDCYWVTSNPGYHASAFDLGEITKISSRMKDGKLEVLGRWFLSGLYQVVGSDDSAFYAGITVTNDSSALFITLTNRDTTETTAGFGKITINDDGTLGNRNVPNGGTLTWNETWCASITEKHTVTASNKSVSSTGTVTSDVAAINLHYMFDRDRSSNATVFTGAADTQYIQYQWNDNKILTELRMTASGTPGVAPKSFAFKASNTGLFSGEEVNLYDTAIEGTETAWSAWETRTFEFPNTVPYKYYRLYITANNDTGVGGGDTEIGQLQFIDGVNLAREDYAVCDKLDRNINYYYPSCSVWDDDHVGIVKFDSTSAPNKIYIIFKQIEDDADGSFLTDNPRPQIIKLDKYLASNSTYSDYRQSIGICKYQNSLWIKNLEYHASDGNRFIHLFDVSESSETYNADLKGTADHENVSFTGDTDGATGVITNIADTSDLFIGQNVYGPGIPEYAMITAITVNTDITIDKNTTAVGTGVSLTAGAGVVVKSTGRFEVADASISGDSTSKAGLSKEGITVTHDGNIFEVCSNMDGTLSHAVLHKRSLQNAVWAENQVHEEFSMLQGDLTLGAVHACMIENSDKKYYWTAEFGVTLNTVKIVRYDISDGSYIGVTVDDLGVLDWTTVYDMCNDDDYLYIYGYDGGVTGSDGCYYTLMSDIIAEMDETFPSKTQAELGLTLITGTNLGTAVRGIDYNPDTSELYLLNDTTDRIDLVSIQKVAGVISSAVYSPAEYWLPAPSSSWAGLSYYSASPGSIYLVNRSGSTSIPSRIWVGEHNYMTNQTDGFYLKHMYQDPGFQWDDIRCLDFDYETRTLLVVDETLKRFIKIKDIRNPEVMQLHTFLSYYNVLDYTKVLNLTSIKKRYFEPEDFKDRRDCPDLYYMGITYEDDYGLSLLHLGAFLNDKTSAGMDRYDIQKIRIQTYKAGANNIIGNTYGYGPIEIEKDMIVVGSETGYGALYIDLKEGTAHRLGTQVQKYLGSLSQRNDGFGWETANNDILQLGALYVNNISVQTFENTDNSDYNGVWPKTYWLLGGTNHGTDLFIVDWDGNQRAPVRIFTNLFNDTNVGRYATWVSPFGYVFAGDYDNTGNILKGVQPVWEVSKNNYYNSADGGTYETLTLGTPTTYITSISQNSRAWCTPSGSVRHQLLVGTYEATSNNGDMRITWFDAENETEEIAYYMNRGGSSVDACYSIDNFEDLVFFSHYYSTGNAFGILKKIHFTDRLDANIGTFYNNWTTFYTNSKLVDKFYPYIWYKNRPVFTIVPTATTMTNYLKYSQDQGILAVSGMDTYGFQMFHLNYREDNSEHHSVELDIDNINTIKYLKTGIFPESFELE